TSVSPVRRARGAKKRRWWLALGAVAILGLTIGGFFLLGRSQRKTAETPSSPVVATTPHAPAPSRPPVVATAPRAPAPPSRPPVDDRATRFKAALQQLQQGATCA